MGTSREVVNRIRWDPRFDARRFVIGYREGEGVEVTPLVAWDGTVPWHRVLHVTRDDGVVVWDRERGLDLITRGEALQGVGPTPGAARVDDGFEPRPTFRWAGGAWGPVDEPDEAGAGPLRVAFWNVLSDRHDPEVTRLEPRLPPLLAALRAQDADVIALVEVTRRTLAALLEVPWVRADYRVSDVTGETLGPEGPLLLSRRPVRLLGRAFDNGKRALVGRLRGPAGPLAVAVVHLTSDQARDAAAKRARELAAVTTHLLARGDEEDALLAGDLNARDDDPGGLAGQGFVDLWRALRPADPGFTFQPARNALAARTSSRLLPARFDRLLLRARGPRPALEASRLERFGNEVELASDHEGLIVDLDRPAALACAPSPRTALAVVPPPSLWPAIDALRREHDPAHGRWMPHVNLLFGFAPPEDLDAALALVRRATAGWLPFRVRLARLGVLEHGAGATVHLVPECEPTDALRRLWADVAARFPGCATRASFTPHLTVGRFPSAAEARARAAAFEAAWTPLELEVRSVVVLERRLDAPFAVREEVALGLALERWLADRGWIEDAPAAARRAAAVERVAAACRGALGPDAEVHVAGSTRLGTALAGSDLDLVLAARDVDLPALARALGAALAVDARSVPGPGPGLGVVRLVLDGLPVDVQVAPPDDDRSPRACREADALRAAGARRVPAARFELVLRAVRAWARARRVDAQAWGFPGGVAWTVLTAWALSDADPAAGPERLLAHVFERASAHFWPAPVALEPTRWAPGDHDLAPILTPVPPAVNAARSVTPSTLAALVAELARAAGLARRVLDGDATWDDLCAPPGPGAEHAHVVVLGPDAEAGEAGRGALEGEGLAVVLALERAPGVRRVRPYAARGEPQVAIGLDVDPTITRVDALVKDALAGPARALAREAAALRWAVDD